LEDSFEGQYLLRKLLIVPIAAVAALLIAVVAFADSTVVVTPANTQGWSTADTRPGGAVNFVADATAPAGVGALELTTDATNEAKAQYIHSADLALSAVTDLSYETKQVSGPLVADPSYQVAVDLNGDAAGGFTNLVYEPYWNGTVIPGTWQTWDVDAGQFWSSGAFTDGTCSVVNGAGGPPFYTLAALQAACPDAVVLGFGVNVGTYNPGYDVETDLVNFNGTSYDFEPYQAATSADQCKQGGFSTITRADGTSFTNQGDCVSYTRNGK
jgi:hypothetical protein